MRRAVLITRPAADCAPIAEAVTALGYVPLLEPLLEIVPLDFSPPDLSRYQALVFTSVNAVRVAAGQITDKTAPVFAVGPQTEEAARLAGWCEIYTGASGVAGLPGVIAAAGLEKDAGKALLYLSAEDIAAPLSVPGHAIERIAVYRAVPETSLSVTCLAALDRGEIAAALFFSSRTARTFADLIEAAGRTACFSQIKLLSISDSVVKSLRKFPWQGVHVAHTPDRECMLRMLEETLTE